jgi:hypothetical protein
LIANVALGIKDAIFEGANGFKKSKNSKFMWQFMFLVTFMVHIGNTLKRMRN